MRLLNLLLTLSSVVAFAQPVRDAAERADDRRDLRVDQRQLRDDRRDRARIASLVAGFDGAAARGDVPAMAGFERQIEGWLAAEVVESRREAAQKTREVKEDRRELGSDRRELRRPGSTPDDRRDRADDRRDLADDRRDVQGERLGLARLLEVQQHLASLGAHYDPAAVATRRALHAQLVGQAGQEVRGDARERREDQRELREDRRETREDRRR